VDIAPTAVKEIAIPVPKIDETIDIGEGVQITHGNDAFEIKVGDKIEASVNKAFHPNVAEAFKDALHYADIEVKKITGLKPGYSIAPSKPVVDKNVIGDSLAELKSSLEMKKGFINIGLITPVILIVDELVKQEKYVAANKIIAIYNRVVGDEHIAHALRKLTEMNKSQEPMKINLGPVIPKLNREAVIVKFNELKNKIQSKEDSRYTGLTVLLYNAGVEAIKADDIETPVFLIPLIEGALDDGRLTELGKIGMFGSPFQIQSLDKNIGVPESMEKLQDAPATIPVAQEIKQPELTKLAI
jgi:hypothetical protein